MKLHEIIIIGGGPAGLTAGLYAKRALMDVILVEKTMPGGQVLFTERVENYPGFPDGIGGVELMEKMKSQATNIGLEILQDEIKEIKERIEPDKRWYDLISQDGKIYSTLSVIFATGANWRHLGVPGEDKFQGRGVSYCATCDGPLFRNKKIVVVGGGDKAVEESIYLTRFAGEVVIVHRRERFRATKILQHELESNKKISPCLNSVLISIEGDKVVKSVKIKNTVDEKEKEIECQGVFIFIGIKPNSRVLKDMVTCDESGYIITDDNMQTSKKGVFACGDVRKNILQQIVIATGEGAKAAISAQKYVETLKGTAYL